MTVDCLYLLCKIKFQWNGNLYPRGGSVYIDYVCNRGGLWIGIKILLYPFAKLVDAIFYILGDKNHCATSVEEDGGRHDLWQR